MVVYKQSGVIREKVVVSGQMVVLGQKWLCSVKSVGIRAKLLYSCKLVLFGKKW